MQSNRGYRVSQYPAIRKCNGLGRAAQTLMLAQRNDAQARETASQWAEEMMGLLPDAFADPHIPTGALEDALARAQLRL